MGENERAIFVRVEGRVQGVGYRAFASSEASSLGVRGWIVNRDDGSVEAALHGAGGKLGDLVGRLRQGPPSAEVVSLDVRSIDADRLAEPPANAQRF